MSGRSEILEGDVRQRPLYFLPWRTGFGLARRVGLVPKAAFGACYRLPDEVIGPDPRTCADRIGDIVGLALRHAAAHAPPPVVIGYSIGTVPATLVAAALGVPLWSFASADRGDLMIWSSPAARSVRDEAERRGYCCGDFSAALRHLNPVERFARCTETAGSWSGASTVSCRMNAVGSSWSARAAICRAGISWSCPSAISASWR